LLGCVAQFIGPVEPAERRRLETTGPLSASHWKASFTAGEAVG
jgi:hypothetical protein